MSPFGSGAAVGGLFGLSAFFSAASSAAFRPGAPRRGTAGGSTEGGFFLETVVVACRTIEDEIKWALDRLSLNWPLVWLEGGLHNRVDRLRERVQEIFEEVDGRCERLIMALGYCGGGISGVVTGDYETVLPLADDCLSLLLGSMDARRRASILPTYFLTGGWMRHENNIAASYRQAIDKYGRAKADRIHQLMLSNYRRFALVCTNCYDLEEAAEKIEPLAASLDLAVEPLPWSDEWLLTLLTGPHADRSRFLVLPPRSQLDFDDWCPLLLGETPEAPDSSPAADG
jgi:hypothetical protein